MLKLKKVSKTFNLGTVNEKKVLHEIDLELNEGDFIKISPAGKRQIFAGENGITYLCIQTKTDSLTQYTADDAIIC